MKPTPSAVSRWEEEEDREGGNQQGGEEEGEEVAEEGMVLLQYLTSVNRHQAICGDFRGMTSSIAKWIRVSDHVRTLCVTANGDEGSQLLLLLLNFFVNVAGDLVGDLDRRGEWDLALRDLPSSDLKETTDGALWRKGQTWVSTYSYTRSLLSAPAIISSRAARIPVNFVFEFALGLHSRLEYLPVTGKQSKGRLGDAELCHEI
ncbi:hypothetical protein AK812_SmicGene6706 [Symbiodinium microadriaticum]|uniref:Uncharacterized protein n=1 Tax=Symbiodinium microadriaticum TaxID=2951 RepID=A0A1Q9EQH2_SYMMI|nr:hypothetical protein AK812_SmicGene6706 [Symbiodinium microadriaticum]